MDNDDADGGHISPFLSSSSPHRLKQQLGEDDGVDDGVDDGDDNGNCDGDDADGGQ